MQEFVLLFIFASVLGYFFSDVVIQKKARRWHHVGIKKGYHIHHSTYGLAAFLAVPTIAPHHLLSAIALAGFGLGIIIEHTKHERFVFIEKIKHQESMF